MILTPYETALLVLLSCTLLTVLVAAITFVAAAVYVRNAPYEHLDQGTQMDENDTGQEPLNARPRYARGCTWHSDWLVGGLPWGESDETDGHRPQRMYYLLSRNADGEPQFVQTDASIESILVIVDKAIETH